MKKNKVAATSYEASLAKNASKCGKDDRSGTVRRCFFPEAMPGKPIFGSKRRDFGVLFEKSAPLFSKNTLFSSKKVSHEPDMRHDGELEVWAEKAGKVEAQGENLKRQGKIDRRRKIGDSGIGAAGRRDC